MITGSGGEGGADLMVDRRLYLHLVTWLGQWPPRQPLQVVRSHRRLSPAWDGRVRPAVAVVAPEGTVLSVPPSRVEPVRRLAACCGALAAPAGRPLERLLTELSAAVDFGDWPVHRGVFRWTTAPTPLPDAGHWVPPDEPDLPSWLRWFSREVLVARDDTGGYLAGVGIKRHDAYGRELAVGTAPHARGRGLARRLVAQAARRVLDEGAVPVYQHGLENAASARVAEAAGFVDRGWRSYGVFPQ